MHSERTLRFRVQHHGERHKELIKGHGQRYVFDLALDLSEL